MDRSSRKKISKVTEILNDTIEQLDLIDIFRTIYQKEKKNEYTFFSIAHGTFYRIDHMLGPHTSLNKFKKIESILNIFSHNSMKLEMNYRKKNGKTQTCGN